MLRPSISVSQVGDSASVQAANASERRAILEKGSETDKFNDDIAAITSVRTENLSSGVMVVKSAQDGA